MIYYALHTYYLIQVYSAQEKNILGQDLYKYFLGKSQSYCKYD
jgi:hypothetical protein